MPKLDNGNPSPQALPLRLWYIRQTPARRIAMISLFALLIASGGKSAGIYAYSPVPATHQLFFTMLAGALIGSRPGAIAALFYMLSACLFFPLWPTGAGVAPLTGLLAGYLWSLPAVAWLSGYYVECYQAESVSFFLMGVCTATATYNMLGTLRLLCILDRGAVADVFVKGNSLFIGQQIAEGALVVFIATSASSMVSRNPRN